MKIYTIPTQFIFSGEFTVRAESRAQAEQMVEDQCGLCLGGSIQSTISDEDVDWDFPIHSTKRISKKQIKKQ